MKRSILSLVFLVVLAPPVFAQNSDVKFIADTLVVQAEGTFDADPDLATLMFDISSQEKELKPAYDGATQSMRRIVALAERSGLKKEDIATGVLTVSPFYQGDRKKRARAYLVRGEIVLKIRDFAQIAPIMDGSVEDGIADFRSLTYSIENEEVAKQRAVAEAMRNAVGRAGAALEQKGQKVGALRYASLDVRQLMGVARLVPYAATETVDVTSNAFDSGQKRMAIAPPPPPPTQPEKITVSASVQCAFQIL
jgi:uncharacterized protein YggE